MKKRTTCLHRFILSGIFLLSLLSTSSFAQILPIDPPKGWEVWNDKVPVSGGIRVGLIDDFKETHIGKQFFFVQIPEHNEKYLCVLLSSRDGRYKAELSYDIEHLAPGRYKFKWPTSYLDRLSQFTGQDLTILCSIGNSCKQDPSYYAYASWGESTQSDTVFLLVNSETPPRVAIEHEDPAKNSIIDCQKMNVRSGVAYNCLCKIPKAKIQLSSNVFVIKRVRRPGGRISFIRYPLPLKP